MSSETSALPKRQSRKRLLLIALLLGFGAVAICALALVVMSAPVLNCLGVAKGDKDTTRCDAALASPLARGKLRGALLAKQASLFYNNAFYQLAIGVADDAIALDDDNFNAHTTRALAYNGQGKLDLAAPDFEKAYQLRPADDDALVDLINTWNKLNEYDKSIAVAQKTAARDPDNATAHWALGWSRYLKGDYDLATYELRWGADKFPGDANSQNLLALSLEAEEKYDAALIYYGKALDLKKDDEILWTNRATLYRKMGRYDEAVADFEEGLKLNRSVDAITGLARTYYMQERYGDTLVLAKEALALDAKNEDALLVAGEAAYYQDDYLMARKYLDDLLKVNPESPDVPYWLASIADNEGDDDKALAGYRSLLDVWSKDAGLRVDIGNLLLDRGQKNDAMGMFNQAIALEPDNAFAYRSRSRAMAELQDWKGGIADASKAISLDPEKSMGYARRAWAEWGALQYDEAEKDYDSAFDHGLKDQWLLEERERLLIEAKHLKRAEAGLAEFQRLFPLAETIGEFEQGVAELKAGDGAASE